MSRRPRSRAFQLITVFIGLVFALIPALVFGLCLGVIFQDWVIGLVSGVIGFCMGLDFIFNGKQGCE